MNISINVTDGVPIYRQIVNQVKYLVASGALLPGEELPPIRTLALQLRVTPNTIVKAYDELDLFSQGMAAMETKAHLELLVAQGRATRADTADGVLFAASA